MTNTMNAKKQQGSPDKQQKKRKPPTDKQREAGTKNITPYKWKPGESGNPSGRSPDILKGIALRVAQLKVGKVLTKKEIAVLHKLGIEDANITIIERMMIDWATSKDSRKNELFAERLAGKVPNVNISAEVNSELVARFRNKLTDGELSRIAAGEEALDILLEKLPDVIEEPVPNVIEVGEEVE